MTEKYQVVGPPGCGKTTYIKRQVERAAAAFGGHDVMVCSLTRAAAAEVRGRDVPIPDSNVGTLHSFAYRALGSPELAEAHLKEWNDAHPRWALSPSKGVRSPEDDSESGEDGGEGATRGDELHTEMNLLRHWRRDRGLWPNHVAAFAKAWGGWLDETGRVDFTGLIERAIDLADEAPSRPLAMFVDEAQDMSRLEVGLIAKWSSSCSTTILVGDPSQALYEWRAAEPEGFFGVGDPNARRVLSQSYRVPVAAHAVAVKWGKCLLDGIEYRPTGRQGQIARGRVPLKAGGDIVRIANEHLAEPGSGTLMIQALCSYMLWPALKVLRKEGIPFHNPKRTRRGDWNPLGERKGTSACDRLLAFASENQSLETVRRWLPMLKAQGVLARGAKEKIKDGIPREDGVLGLFENEDVAMRAFSGDLDWLVAHATKEFRERLRYPIAVLKSRGEKALKEEPRIQVGTIHAFKGAEADHVVVCPDLSRNAFEEHFTKRGLGVRRAFYVALTRTRDRMTFLPPSSMRAVDLPR